MVSRQSAATGHAASSTSNSTPSSASSTSSIKPTGWIRSNSASRPALSDRTNFPSKSTPLRSLPKPTVQSAGRRATPSTSGNAGRQQKLSSFFAPNTAPPAASKVAPAVRQSSFQDSPSVARARARSVTVEGNSTNAEAAAADLGDDDLEARAASLLRGRFGSVSRSLNASRSSTPTRAPSPPPARVDLQPSRFEPASASRRTMPPPAPLQQPKPDTRPPQIQQEVTPPRAARRPAEQHQQPASSSPPFEATLMQESLSNFTPLAWEKMHASRMALFQRLAGVPKEEILRGQRANMAEQVAKAHARMQPRSPGSPRKMRGNKQLHSVSPSRKNKMKHAAALTCSPSKERSWQRPEAVLRSPRTNRRIYALETQLGGGAGQQRATSLQPLHRGVFSAAADHRRAVSEARCPSAVDEASSSRQAFDSKSTREAQAATAAEEEESETLPLPWPADEDEEEGIARLEDQADETQPLPWDDRDDEPQPAHASQQQEDQQLVEVPPSDDEDLLLQHVIPSSSSSPCSSPSPSPSRIRPARQPIDTPPPAKRQRIKQEQHDCTPLSNRLMRTPLQPPPLPAAGLARVSPVSLIPSMAGAGGSNRFDRVVAALKREERRQHKGAQLHLDSFVSSTRCKSEAEAEVEGRREGLSADLNDVLSDDDEEDEGDVTVGQEETQPLPWSSPPRREPPPLNSSPLPASTQRSNASSASTRTTSSSSSAVSLPSEGNLDDAGNTQLRSFFRGL
ncbi:conserved hypothetical protein [Sporisorium reilianum SRZ2]|uniref:Uncharacterized protein n=1 Tax=Sporisorium reilianum (strain SRZ2) TaxID=999809 RepID=E6ZW58_SPORE|nr:conserved hypothetical protein [Sporisorium reilianum SRZ2]